MSNEKTPATPLTPGREMPPPLAHESDRHKLDFERIRLLYSNARFAVLGIFICTFFFSLFLWERLPKSVWFAWLTAIAAVNLPRILLIGSFFNRMEKGQIVPEKILAWEWRFYTGLVGSGLTWGAISWFPYTGDPLSSLIFVGLNIIGMSASSILTLITSFRMGATFLSLTLFPLLARALFLGDRQATIFALMLLSYYVVYLRMAHRLHTSVIENINLKIENERLSLHDTLTGLGNRRQLGLYLESALPRADRHGKPMCILMIDLDHFKRYNDTCGHSAGDLLLGTIGALLRETVRAGDLAVRYGGEEFLVVLSDTGLATAREIAGRLRHHIERGTEATASIGIAERRSGQTFIDLVKVADEALYQAKEGGRNRVAG